VNQSKEYGIAIVVSWVEFWLEALILPSLKASIVPALVGLCLVICGQTLRTLSMYQAGPSFTHLVVEGKTHRHKLVTSGVYSHLRHPGYFGWFYWSVGTQLILGNPLCAIAYFTVARRFFQDRIPHEEAALLNMFGDEYTKYKQRTYLGIPGIKA
jgi:protein-S-isoprenylcysteine O-methyltransferase